LLKSLQVARGMAALAVVLFHARLGTSAFVAKIPERVDALLALGTLGVDFFFVLSGFIILHVHLDDPSTGAAARAYAFKRATRVYLPYLPVSLVLVCAYLLFPQVSHSNRDWGVFTSLTLLPSAHEPALLVASWTLVHEVMFYSVFLVYFVSHRAFIGAVVIWAALLLKQAVAPASFSLPFLNILMNPINIEFVFGLVCAVAFRSLNARHGLVSLAIGAAVLISFFVWGDEGLRIVFGLGAAFVVLGLALNDRIAPSGLGTALVGLGGASYAIYLLHDPIISLTSRAAAPVAPLGAWPASLAFSAVASVVIGWVLSSLARDSGLGSGSAALGQSRSRARRGHTDLGRRNATCLSDTSMCLSRCRSGGDRGRSNHTPYRSSAIPRYRRCIGMPA
jgi:exopolysaccharide production protein ExoZ